jgi:hypothetical protein
MSEITKPVRFNIPEANKDLAVLKVFPPSNISMFHVELRKRSHVMFEIVVSPN